jgi:hypothetical protein
VACFVKVRLSSSFKVARLVKDVNDMFNIKRNIKPMHTFILYLTCSIHHPGKLTEREAQYVGFLIKIICFVKDVRTFSV